MGYIRCGAGSSGGGLDNLSVISSKSYVSTDNTYSFTDDYGTVIFSITTVINAQGTPQNPNLKLNGVSQSAITNVTSQTAGNNSYVTRSTTWTFVFKDIKSGDKLTWNNLDVGTFAFGSYSIIGQ